METTNRRTPRAHLRRRLVLETPAARAALLHGISQMTALVRPTIGPLARTVAIAAMSPRAAPEVLDNAATILRRTIQLGDPFADMGAMLVRHLAWTVFERVGDGAATAVVLAHALLEAAAPAVAAGADPHALRRGIARGLAVAVAELQRQSRPVETATELASGIAGIVRDAALAHMIGELVEAVGPEGAVLFEESTRTTSFAEYLDGQRWEGGLLSPYLVPAGTAIGRLVDPRIFVTDHPLVRAEDLLPVLEACIAANEKRLLVIAPEVRDQALALLILNRERGVLDGALAVRAPGTEEQRTAILEDIAIATGARPILQIRGMPLSGVALADLGRARQVWGAAEKFGILGGGGEKAAIRARIREARAELRAISPDDASARRHLGGRIGKLAGTAAILYIGAPTERARVDLRARAEAAVISAQAALREGAVPGGGAAFLACVPALERLAAHLPPEEAPGARFLARALTAPMRAIAANAGIDASTLFADPQARTPGWTFDALRGRWVDAWDEGIMDPLPVVQAALEGSVSTAVMALTTDVLIRHKRPPRATDP